jgi:glycosyltransferase involved in cell wall biosynthesis
MAHRVSQFSRVTSSRNLRVPLQKSALLIGYIDAQLGLGQSLRGLASAMSRTSIHFRIYPFGIGVEGRRSTPYMPERYDQTNFHAVNVIEVATDELPTVFNHISEGHFSLSYNILRTYWELSKAPEAWRSHLSNIQEIWVPNSFVAESFRGIFDRPIIVVPPCIDVVLPDLNGRSHFGLCEGKFYFLFSFDYFSFPDRKNPLAVVRAFHEAFPEPSPSVGLIIKSSGTPGHFPDIKDDLRAASRDDERIEIINESITREEMLALIGAADCYVSLHRSEGFGLGMAEAMALGKPVIGTDYSGNKEFLTQDSGYPVPCTLKSVGLGEYVHSEGQVWAYPHEAACSAAMVRVVSNHEERSAKALAGKRFVQARYGLHNVARIVEDRLHEIFEFSSERLKDTHRKKADPF